MPGPLTSSFGTLVQPVTQTDHGLSVGNVVRNNGTAYVKAQADSDSNAEVIGIATAVADANNFSLTTFGRVTGLSGLTAGAVHFLSPSVAGALTVTEPSTDGQISKPVLIADSTTAGYFFNMRGSEVGGGATAPYLVYTALLTQSGEDAPVATVLQNTLGGTVVWSHASEGVYPGTLVGAFPAGKVPAQDYICNAIAPVRMYRVERNNDDEVVVRVYDNGTNADFRLTDNFIEIRRYP